MSKTLPGIEGERLWQQHCAAPDFKDTLLNRMEKVTDARTLAGSIIVDGSLSRESIVRRVGLNSVDLTDLVDWT